MNSYIDCDLDFLLSPQAIRHSAEAIFALTQNGATHFAYHPERFEALVSYVVEVISENYPDYNVPFHSRWGHFRTGGIDRVGQVLQSRILGLDKLEQARIKLDLVMTSVLLDAGAGNDWQFSEEISGKTFVRSEGLGLASFYLFLEGGLSHERALQVSAQGLQSLSKERLCRAFQVGPNNPLVGMEGRLSLLKNMGHIIAEKEDLFPGGRPGNLLDYLHRRHGTTFSASQLLRAVLDGLGEIWPGRIRVKGVNLGDTWHYEKIPGKLAVFHKLSQWMAYSLCEPLMEAGFHITEVEKLTGLAEYRNGGLLLDLGLLSLWDKDQYGREHAPDSELIIEWRGLTIALLDRIGKAVQLKLNKSPAQFPLAKVLEGGTWWAGRKAAQALRFDGSAPLRIVSDGTVF